jgi:pyridinium-3,5-biscarboxylic acid mononucleotide sulfurtransferase
MLHADPAQRGRFVQKDGVLMLSTATQEKYDALRQILAAMNSLVIGFSGGVDSTLLLKVAVEKLGDKTLAMIGRSATYPTREFEEALALAKSIGARYEIVQTEETDDLKFKENPPDRCYYCKTELFGKLREIAQRDGIAWIADGTITDDLGDFRPGMRARSEGDVRSPLLEAGFSKDDVRELSKHLGLPTWDKPSFACLSSRFPYGTPILRENLSRVDAAETFLRDNNFRRFRVRFHDSTTARVEVDPAEISRLVQEPFRTQLVGHFKQLGFTYVTLDLQGYRTGSMNEVLSEEEKAGYLEKKGQ